MLTCDPAIVAIRQELDQSRHRHARLRNAVCGVVLSAGAVIVLCGAKGDKNPSAKPIDRLVMADAKGRVRAELGTDERGNTVFYLLDAKGNKAINMGVTADGRPAIGVTQSSDGRQITLAFNPIGGGGLTLYDKRLTPRIQLQTAADGTPRLEFRDQANKPIESLPK